MELERMVSESNQFGSKPIVTALILELVADDSNVRCFIFKTDRLVAVLMCRLA